MIFSIVLFVMYVLFMGVYYYKMKQRIDPNVSKGMFVYNSIIHVCLGAIILIIVIRNVQLNQFQNSMTSEVDQIQYTINEYVWELQLNVLPEEVQKVQSDIQDELNDLYDIHQLSKESIAH